MAEEKEKSDLQIGSTKRWEGLSLLSRAGAFLAILFMLLIVGLILLEILVRSLFGSSTQVASEYSGYFMVGLVLCGFALTFKDGAFIRINLLLSRLSPPAARACKIVAALLCLGITLYALVYCVEMVWESYSLDMRADTMAETPFWIPQLTLPIGLSLLALELILYILRRIWPS